MQTKIGTFKERFIQGSSNHYRDNKNNTVAIAHHYGVRLKLYNRKGEEVCLVNLGYGGEVRYVYNRIERDNPSLEAVKHFKVTTKPMTPEYLKEIWRQWLHVYDFGHDKPLGFNELAYSALHYELEGHGGVTIERSDMVQGLFMVDDYIDWLWYDAIGNIRELEGDDEALKHTEDDQYHSSRPCDIYRGREEIRIVWNEHADNFFLGCVELWKDRE